MRLSKHLFSGRWGLEREVLRVDPTGRLATTPHPFPPHEAQMTVDFAEAQAELITGVNASPLAALDELEGLQDRLQGAIGAELLWPFSAPGFWEPGQEVKPARFDDHPAWEDQRRYRNTLIDHHGGARQSLSGIHVNYSFGPEHPGGDYFALARNFLRYQPLLTYLLASSPWLGDAFRVDLGSNRSDEARRSAEFCAPHTTSVRQSGLGYSLTLETEAALDVRYDSLEEYLAKLGSALTATPGRPPLLGHEREFYTSVRPKGTSAEKGRTLDALAAQGVSYLEFRPFDLDPLAPLGISPQTLLFLELFLIAATVLPSPPFQPGEQTKLRMWQSKLAQCSLSGSSRTPSSLRKLWAQLLPTLRAVAEFGTDDHRAALTRFDREIDGRSQRTIERVSALLKARPALEWGLERAQLHRAWNALELSTKVLIAEADLRGVAVTLIDADENLILLEKGHRREYVKQATRTSADPYIAAVLMESKVATKKVLRRGQLRVPEGREFTTIEAALAAWTEFRGRKVVVKPNATNFGDGVSLLDQEATETQWREAVSTAFALDRQVLVEEFAEGLEFRFLVIDGKTTAVLHRMPANVVGDEAGLNILALVEKKNQHPWRGEGYKKPLEKLRLGEVELDHLASQGLTPDSVPEVGQRVFLRKNSNISTGGDSIDFTDRMPSVYSRIAERAAAAVGARICGLDMILPDWTDSRPSAVYTILELNFNPALHIHTFPAEGINRRPAGAVLDLLGFPATTLDDNAFSG